MKSNLNMKRVWVITAVVAAGMILFGFDYARRHSTHPGIHEYMAVTKAAAEYARQLKAEGSSVPKSVTLEELRTRGVLRQEDAKDFEGPPCDDLAQA